MKKELLLQLSVMLMVSGALVPANTGTINTTTNNSATSVVDENGPKDRKRYTEIIENKLKTWDQIIRRVKTGTYSSMDFHEDVTPEEAKNLAKELSAKRDILAKLLKDLKKADGEHWKNAQVSIEKELRSLNQKFRDAE